jgi:hypothetical protein
MNEPRWGLRDLAHERRPRPDRDVRIVLDEREDGICASDPFGLLADGQVSVAQ